MAFVERFKKLKEYEREQEEKEIRKIEAANREIARLGPYVKNVCKQFSESTDLKLKVREEKVELRFTHRKIKQAYLTLNFYKWSPMDNDWNGFITVDLDPYDGNVKICPPEYGLFKSMSIPFKEFSEEKLAECLESAYKQMTRYPRI